MGVREKWVNVSQTTCQKFAGTGVPLKLGVPPIRTTFNLFTRSLEHRTGRCFRELCTDRTAPVQSRCIFFEAAITLELQTLALPAFTRIGRGASERTGMSNESAKEYIRASGSCGRGTPIHLNRSLPTLEAWRLRSPTHNQKCHYCGSTIYLAQDVKSMAGDNTEAFRLLCQTDARRQQKGTPFLTAGKRELLDKISASKRDRGPSIR